MSYRLPSLACACLVASLVGCDVSIEGPEPTLWQADLLPTGGSMVRGQAAAVSSSARTEVSIKVFGEPGSTYLWRLRTGSCNEAGTVVGAIDSYPPLETDRNGSATRDIILNATLRGGRNYHAIVLTAATRDSMAACGNLHELSSATDS